MVMFSDRPQHVLPTIAHTGYRIQVSQKILQGMYRAIADSCRVSDTIEKVIVDPCL